MNLESLNVQEMSGLELQLVDGGWIGSWELNGVAYHAMGLMQFASSFAEGFVDGVESIFHP